MQGILRIVSGLAIGRNAILMNPKETIATAIFIAIAAGLIWLSIRLLRLTREGRLSMAVAKKARDSSLRGHRAEEEARRVLERRGFTVIERHVETTIGWWIDEAWHETTITADYLVQKDGRRSIVEVKTGKESRATHRHTRRQLLEYRVAFAVDDIYLYDAEREILNEIDFEPMLKMRKRTVSQGYWLIIATFIGFFIGYYLSR